MFFQSAAANKAGLLILITGLLSWSAYSAGNFLNLFGNTKLSKLNVIDEVVEADEAVDFSLMVDEVDLSIIPKLLEMLAQTANSHKGINILYIFKNINKLSDIKKALEMCEVMNKNGKECDGKKLTEVFFAPDAPTLERKFSGNVDRLSDPSKMQDFLNILGSMDDEDSELQEIAKKILDSLKTQDVNKELSK